MDVFQFRQNIVAEYEQFTRSFTRIRAEDIRDYVNEQYASQKYCKRDLNHTGSHAAAVAQRIGYRLA